MIKDHYNYKFIEKTPFHEYEYESEYGSNAFELNLREEPKKGGKKGDQLQTTNLSKQQQIIYTTILNTPWD